MSYAAIIAKEFSVREDYVQNIIALLDEGNTIPFIARYRKEMHGAMDDQLIRQIAEKLEEEKQKIVIVALVDTLEYLKRGGRISKTVAFAGALLNIKPVLSVIDGEVSILGKARGSKMGNNLLVQEIEKAGGVDFSKPVLLGYTGLSDALLVKYIEDSRHIWSQGLETVRYTTIGSVIGTHAGPGAVAVAFFKK